MKKIHLALPVTMALLLLAGCGAPVGLAGSSTGLMWITKPSEPPSADTAGQMAEHESWCYRTLGTIECYAEPQDVPPSRLINVDPPNRYPLTRRAYAETLTQSRLDAAPKVFTPDAASNPAPEPQPVQIAPPQQQAAPAAVCKPDTPPKHKAKPAKHKKKKKAKKPKKC
jgi:hypothetical protein